MPARQVLLTLAFLSTDAGSSRPRTTALKPHDSVRWYQEVLGWIDRWRKRP